MAIMKRKQMLEEELRDYSAALSKDEVANIIGVSRRKVDDLVEKKILPSFTVDDTSQKKQIKVNKSDLMIYMLNDLPELAPAE